MGTNIKQKVGLDFAHSKIELIPDTDCEIVHEDGKWFVVRKPKKYPKTLEECCNILGIELSSSLKHGGQTIISYKIATLACLQELLICRDAYWKIAGGWKYDVNETEKYFYIVNKCGHIVKEYYMNFNHIIAFPTAEMRNAFYDNFKDLIEQCKELL